MSLAENKAVFLSYASQDAEAARRICEALRTAGVEVWFDQSELRGGDAWDAKIRKQIKECALFVPIISANTQARREGYFRIEWKLAAQRTHAIAEGTPFLLPVVIDETSEPEALVPGEFREVQWTALRPAGVAHAANDALVAAFGARVASLAHLEPSPRPAAGLPGTRQERFRTAPRRRLPWFAAAAAGLALTAALLLWSPWRQSSSPNPRNASPALQLAEQAYALTQKVTLTREDLDAAEILVQRALQQEPESPRVWAVRAWIQAAFLERRLDYTRKRRDDAHSLAKQALVLNPDDADALNALARVMLEQESWTEAEKLGARAVHLAPDNQRSRLSLAAALTGQGRKAEARAMLEEAVRRRPTDVLARCELANSFAPLIRPPGEPTAAELATALEHLETAIAQQPCEPALVAKAILAGSRLGDLAKMREALDALEKLPLAERTTDRAIYAAMWCGLLERNLPRVLAAAALTTRSYLSDTMAHLPKEHYVAMAYRMAGKEAHAQEQWRIAEGTMREQMRDHPTDGREPMRLALILASAGKREEASREIGPIAATWNEAMTPAHARNLAGFFAAMGDAEKAAPLIDRAMNAQTYLTDHTLLLEPRWDGLRGHPAFDAVAEKALQRIARSKAEASRGAARVAAPAPESKSVAVLAFDNLSEDKANEYFSDGISEELINTLGRVPGLTVKGRTSAFYFKDKKNLSSAEIARQLGVAYLVRGGVRKSGGKVRITAQLTRATTDEIVWTLEPADRNADDTFAVQAEIAALIAQNLQLKLSAPANKPATVNIDAYQLYLEGRELWRGRTFEGYEKAEQLFERALAIAPTFARAYVGLADVWMVRALDRAEVGGFAQRDSPLVKKIAAAVDRALELDPGLAEAHTSLGNVRWIEWKLDAAVRELRLALVLNPNYATAHHWMGRIRLSNGEVEEAVGALKRAHELEPLSSRIADNYSLALSSAQQTAEGLAMAERALALQADSQQALRFKALALSELGRHEEAFAVIQRYLTSDYSGDNGVHFAVYVLARGGRRAEAETLLDAVSPTRPRGGARFMALLALNRTDEFFAALQPETLTSPALDEMYFWPVLDPVRSDARFVSLLKTVGVADAHGRAQAWRKAQTPAGGGVK